MQKNYFSNAFYRQKTFSPDGFWNASMVTVTQQVGAGTDFKLDAPVITVSSIGAMPIKFATLMVECELEALHLATEWNKDIGRDYRIVLEESRNWYYKEQKESGE